MYNHNKAQQSKNRVHISWDILYLIDFWGLAEDYKERLRFFNLDNMGDSKLTKIHLICRLDHHTCFRFLVQRRVLKNVYVYALS